MLSIVLFPCLPGGLGFYLLTGRVLQLRDIEILMQQQMEVLQAEGKDDPVLGEIQKILYSTEVSYLEFFSLSLLSR